MRPTKLQKLRGEESPSRKGGEDKSRVEDFIAYLRGECHLSANTISAYGNDLKRFMQWADGRDPASISIVELSDYAGWLHRESLAPSSAARNIVAVRTFFKYLQLEGLLLGNPADLLATQRMWERVPKVLSHARSRGS